MKHKTLVLSGENNFNSCGGIKILIMASNNDYMDNVA